MPVLLLTGGTGFVGRNLIPQANARGWDVLAAVRDEARLGAQMEADGSSATALPCDPGKWAAISPDAAILSAGVLFARNREEYFATNLEWTLEVIRALPDRTKIVVLSSQSAGGPTPLGLAARTEETPDSPLTWYGESKLAVERAIITEFGDRNITILRPPMILGARDTATLPLFKMGRGLVRIKPGLRAKRYSFAAVQDVVSAIFAALECKERGPFYLTADAPITDRELLATAAECAGGRGVTVPLPQALVRVVSAVVDKVPSLRAATPSLTRDRAREIWPDSWVVSAARFREATGWRAEVSLGQALGEAFEWYRRTGQL